MKISLPKETLERVVSYLITRPWQEVNALIREVEQVARVLEEPSDSPTNEAEDPEDEIGTD